MRVRIRHDPVHARWYVETKDWWAFWWPRFSTSNETAATELAKRFLTPGTIKEVTHA